MYVRDSIRFRVLHDFMSDEFEVLWMQILPKRLPTGISSIIVGTVYHPPSTCDSSMRIYLCESMSSLEAHFPGRLRPYSTWRLQQTESLPCCKSFWCETGRSFSDPWAE